MNLATLGQSGHSKRKEDTPGQQIAQQKRAAGRLSLVSTRENLQLGRLKRVELNHKRQHLWY